MDSKLKNKIARFNEIRYVGDTRPYYGNSFRIIVGTLKAVDTVTTAPNIKE